jgi:hypothetical protein
VREPLDHRSIPGRLADQGSQKAVQEPEATLLEASLEHWGVKRRITHCGSCVPCQVRRIAIEGCCPDLTAYGRDLWRERIRELPWDDDGRRNLSELIQFAIQFDSLSNDELTSTWPELISRDFDSVQVINMYKRFAAEAMQVWQGYPEVRALL